MQNTQDLQYRLIRIDELSFNFKADTDLLASLTEDNIQVRHLVQTIFNIEKNLVKIKAGIQYGKNEADFFTLELLYTFAVDDINRVVQIDVEQQRLNYQTELIYTFLNIAIGGLRGAMFERTKNTRLADFPMPLFDIKYIGRTNSFQVEK